MARFQVEFQSKYLLRKAQMMVYYPSMNLGQTIQAEGPTIHQDYEKKYPLAICLHGFGDSMTGFETHIDVQALCDKYQIGFVMINAENKWYLNFSAVDRFYDYLNLEVCDFVYATFKVFDPSLPKYIIGVSMGGYGSLYHYLSNISSYKACCAMSPATKADNNLEEILKVPTLKDLFLKTKDEKKNIFLCIGTKDFVIEPSREFNKFLVENKTGVEYKFVEGYGHSWDLWRLEINNFLEYIKELN